LLYCTVSNPNGENGDGVSGMDGSDLSGMAVDGNEFEIGYNTQKILNRILENQNNEMRREREAERAGVRREMAQLREENERQQEILMQGLSPEGLAEATFKNEIVKLTEQNLVSLFGDLVCGLLAS
jgi:myosin-5